MGTNFEITWRPVDHACRFCGGGRILEAIEYAEHVRCADCGAEADGGAEVLCWCGAVDEKAPVRLKCAKNPKPTPDCPAEIIAIEVPVDRDKKKLGGVPVRSRTSGNGDLDGFL